MIFLHLPYWLVNPIKAGPFLGGDQLGGGFTRTPPWYLSYGRSKLLKLTSPKQMMSQASIWALDQPSKLNSLLRSSLEVAEDHDCDYCETNFQNRQFLSYRHVIYIKKIIRSYWLQIWTRKFIFCQKKMILDRFCKKSSCFEGEKNFDAHFFCRKKQKS